MLPIYKTVYRGPIWPPFIRIGSRPTDQVTASQVGCCGSSVGHGCWNWLIFEGIKQIGEEILLSSFSVSTFLVGKGLVLGGWPSKIEVIWNLGLQVLQSHGVLCSKMHQEKSDSKAPKKEEDRKKASGSHAGVVSTPRKCTSPQNQHATGSIGNTSSNQQFLGDMLVFRGVIWNLKIILTEKENHFPPRRQGPIFCCWFFWELPESVGQGGQRWGQMVQFPEMLLWGVGVARGPIFYFVR